ARAERGERAEVRAQLRDGPRRAGATRAARALGAEPRLQAGAGERAVWKRDAALVEQRREQVAPGDPRIAGHALARAGCTHEERNAQRLLEEVHLREHAVAAEHLAVVGGEDDERARGEAELVQRVEDRADPVVELEDQAVVERRDLAEALLRRREWL